MIEIRNAKLRLNIKYSKFEFISYFGFRASDLC